jgi:SAM-dependent methyltransferase
MPSASEEFFRVLNDSAGNGTFVKLTLGRYRGPEESIRKLHVRPVTLRSGPHWSFTWHHAKRDITKNLTPADGMAQIQRLIGGDFGTANLFTTNRDAQLEFPAGEPAWLKIIAHPEAALPSDKHDRKKARTILPDTVWLKSLGVTTANGLVREGMAAKYKQINRFVELLAPLVQEAPLPVDRPIDVVDMGCGKGYLTFAIWQHLHDVAKSSAHVRGIDLRPEMVELCNAAARTCGCEGLEFTAGAIADADIPAVDILIALHACDTATDDAIARGIAGHASLIVVAPCCQHELSPQLTAPAVLAPALRHGIFHERHADFVTDAVRVLLLEWAGYDTRAFEFISTEHTAKNLMIAAVRSSTPPDREVAAARVRDFAGFYGVRDQRLARQLDFILAR